MISADDSGFIAYLRSLSICAIVFGHVGGFWVFRPYSEFLHVFVPVFFFLSGAVSCYSYERSPSVAQYYIKRLTGLLVPYYLLCLLQLVLFVCENGHMPSYNFENILLWLQLRPVNDIMVFPVGQVWFLHTLLVITIISPLYFYLRKAFVNKLMILMCAIILFSSIQLFWDVEKYFYLLGNNLYKPLIHSSFFIFGMIYFAFLRDNTKFLLIFSSILFVVSLSVVLLFKLNIDYGFHTFAPDLYYVAGSYASILIFLYLKNQIVKAVRFNIQVVKVFNFIHRNTFSIFLLHSLMIYIIEKGLGFDVPEDKKILFGIAKFIVVLIGTCILSEPFTRLVAVLSLFLKKILFKLVVPVSQ